MPEKSSHTIAATWPVLVGAARSDPASLPEQFKTSNRGLSRVEASRRLAKYGLNQIAVEKKLSLLQRLISYFKDPLVLLLVGLGIVSFLTRDFKTAVIVTVMMLLSVSLRMRQELKADKAEAEIKAMVRTTAAVVRDGVEKEISLDKIVPGDIVRLNAGDIIPADLRIIESKDLYLNQATLTGEPMPVEKHAQAAVDKPGSVFELPNICFMGTAVASGTALSVVLQTGVHTYFGSLAENITKVRELTAFDKGVTRFAWLMLRFILVLVPLVFFINGFGKGDWLQAFFFAVAVAIGLTPELLPVIVTVNLSKGAVAMAKKKVIVKRLNAIQNFGALDVLCTDKTGTLTTGIVVLVKHFDVHGEESAQILEYGFINSYYQTGLSNLLDVAVKKFNPHLKSIASKYSKIDEIPFDFERRRMSVIVAAPNKKHLLLCKGAVEEMLSISTHVQDHGRMIALDARHRSATNKIIEKFEEEGFRLIAIATREFPASRNVYSKSDESGLVLRGFLAFLDPPKESAASALKALQQSGVTVKILTGDNDAVARKICRDVGIAVDKTLIGTDIESLSDVELAKRVESISVFSKLEPLQKVRIIKALQANGHAVGFLGDGINDAPSLKAADIGISVDTAVDIAKESSDIILLQKSLSILNDGVREGRRVFGNIVKYIKMAASSNFGNMFSVVGGSLFLPFLPMLPIQIITNNLLYDFSQSAIPTDDVDPEYLLKPRQWRIDEIEKFILWIGPISSIFDYLTFAMMIFIFGAYTNPALFHTGWFVESLLTQTLIIHVLRTKKLPFFQSRASTILTLTTGIIVAIGIYLPYSFLANALGLVPLPILFWPLLAAMLVAYVLLAQVGKYFVARRYPDI